MMVQKIVNKTRMIMAALLVVGCIGFQFAYASPAFAADNARPTIKPNECSVRYNQLTPDNCHIIWYILLVTRVISGLVGIIITGSLIIAGIQYSMSGSDPQGIAAARRRIRNSIVALLFFIFAYPILEWLIPGGMI